MEYIVGELVELNKAGGKSKIQIAALLGQISAGAKTTAAAGAKVFGGINSRCARGTKKLTNFIKKLKADLAADGARISQAKGKLSGIAKAAKKLAKQVKAAQAGVGRLAKRYRKQIELDRQVTVEAVAKQDVIKRLRDIINDELVNGAKVGAFVQVKQFREAISELQAKTNKMDDSLFAPMVSALVNLASQRNFSDQKILKKILRLLAKIDANLAAFLKRHAKDNKRILGLLAKQRTLKIKQLRDYLKLSAQSTEDVKYYNNVMEHANTSMGLLNAQIGRKTRELKQWSGLCAAEKAFGNRLAKEFGGFMKYMKAASNFASR